MAVWLFLLQCCATWAMVGLIWFVQVVHYPLFDGVGQAGFSEYESRHQQRTGLVVIPPMVAELLTAAAMLVYRPPGAPRWAAAVGLALVVGIWASTFLVQVPAHGRLGGGFNAGAHRVLVLSNWFRTIAWTARGGLLAWLSARMLGGSA